MYIHNRAYICLILIKTNDMKNGQAQRCLSYLQEKREETKKLKAEIKILQSNIDLLVQELSIKND